MTLPGLYTIEAKRIAFDADRRVSQLRVYRQGLSPSMGGKRGEVSTDLAMLAVCDADLHEAFATAESEAHLQWLEDLTYGFPPLITFPCGVISCEAAGTSVAYIASGFGDGTYPVFALEDAGVPIGLEVMFIAPDTPYPFNNGPSSQAEPL